MTKGDVFENTSAFDFSFPKTRIVVGWTHDVSLLPCGSCMKDDQRIWQGSPAQFMSFGQTLTARCFPSFDSCPVLCSCFPPCIIKSYHGPKVLSAWTCGAAHVCSHAQERSLDDSKIFKVFASKNPPKNERRPKHAQKMPRLALLIPVCAELAWHNLLLDWARVLPSLSDQEVITIFDVSWTAKATTLAYSVDLETSARAVQVQCKSSASDRCSAKVIDEDHSGAVPWSFKMAM